METKPWATRGTGRNAQANERISFVCLTYQRAFKSHFTWALGYNFLGDLKGSRKRRNFTLQCCLLFIQFKEMDLRTQPTSLNLREMNNPKYDSWTCRVALSVQMGTGHICANPDETVTLPHTRTKFGCLMGWQKLFSLLSTLESGLKGRIQCRMMSSYSSSRQPTL